MELVEQEGLAWPRDISVRTNVNKVWATWAVWADYAEWFERYFTRYGTGLSGRVECETFGTGPYILHNTYDMVSDCVCGRE